MYGPVQIVHCAQAYLSLAFQPKPVIDGNHIVAPVVQGAEKRHQIGCIPCATYETASEKINESRLALGGCGAFVNVKIEPLPVLFSIEVGRIGCIALRCLGPFFGLVFNDCPCTSLAAGQHNCA